MACIKTIRPEQAPGELTAEYDRGCSRAGEVSSVLAVQSLNAPGLRQACRGRKNLENA